MDDQNGPIMGQAWPSDSSRPKLGKKRFEWPRGLNIVKQVFWKSIREFGGEGAGLWEPGKTYSGGKSEVLLGF